MTSKIQRRYFEDFAQGHYRDSSIATLVQDEFDIVCINQMKGMVCQAKRKGIRPPWIRDTLWKTMCTYWAKKTSKTASNSRNSSRGGLGPLKNGLNKICSYIPELAPNEMNEIFLEVNKRLFNLLANKLPKELRNKKRPSEHIPLSKSPASDQDETNPGRQQTAKTWSVQVATRRPGWAHPGRQQATGTQSVQVASRQQGTAPSESPAGDQEPDSSGRQQAIRNQTVRIARR
ncbi:hypothetical protein Bca101_072199 [Brassica carinata]